jgi:hypothetical protein
MSDIAAEVVGQNQPAQDAQPAADNSFSFGSLHDKALAAMGTDNSPAGEPAPVPETTPQAQPVAENVDNATAAQLATLKPTDLVEVTVDGEKVRMPWSQAEGGVMRQAKFTKEMTALRREQAAFEGERSHVGTLKSEREMLVNLLNDEQMMKQFLAAKYPNLLAQAKEAAAQEAGVDPEDIATVGQIKAVEAAAAKKVQEIADQFTKQLEERTSNIGREIEDKQATLKLANDINTTVKSLFTDHPYITKVIPHAEQVLRYTVSQMQPRTEAETVEAFKTVFGGWVENYQSTVQETNKSSVLAKQKLVQNNIQPPGGSGVQPQPTTFMKQNPMTGKRDVNWDALREAAAAVMK